VRAFDAPKAETEAPVPPAPVKAAKLSQSERAAAKRNAAGIH
jgi:hypothetical protein